MQETRSDPWVRKIPWRRAWQHPPVFLVENPHGQRSLVGYSPWGCKESGTTERVNMHMCASLHPPSSLLLLKGWNHVPFQTLNSCLNFTPLAFHSELLPSWECLVVICCISSAWQWREAIPQQVAGGGCAYLKVEGSSLTWDLQLKWAM